MTQMYTVVIPHVKYEVQECIEADTPEQAAEIALDRTWIRPSSFASTARHLTVVDLTTADVTPVPFTTDMAAVAKEEDWTAKDRTHQEILDRMFVVEVAAIMLILAMSGLFIWQAFR